VQETSKTKTQSFPSKLDSSARSQLSFDSLFKKLLAGDVRLALIVVDLATIFLTFLSASWFNLEVVNTQKLVFLLSLWLIVFSFYGLYRRRICLSVADQYPQIIQAATMAAVITIAFSVFFPNLLILPVTTITGWLLSLIFIPLGRLPVRAFQTYVRNRGMYQRNTLIIGAGQVGTILAKKLLSQPALGLNLIGFLDENPPNIQERADLKARVFRNENDLGSIVRKYNISQIIIAFSTASHRRMLKIIRECEKLPVEFSIVPRLFEIFTTNVDLDEIEGIPLMNLRKARLESLNLALKRGLDIIFSLLVLVLLSPLLILIAIVIKLDSPGPILFRQKRVGKNGKLFTMLKFRSMVADAEVRLKEVEHLNEADGPLFQIKDDPRVTRVGKIIRRLSIDELPQFFNVLKGDMSIVGPRPALPNEAATYEEWHKRRLNVAPGITGFWQVLGRNELPFDEMVKLDLNYIQNWSLSLDLKLILKTITAVFRKRGAY
jgi:exopolysaccharide biosynthesis polyprenyl glycosylphosphotransferase